MTYVATPSHLSSVIKSLRKKRGLTQSDLGERLGLSQERVSVMENHPEKIPTDQLFTLLMALGAEIHVTPKAIKKGPKDTNLTADFVGKLDW